MNHEIIVCDMVQMFELLKIITSDTGNKTD